MSQPWEWEEDDLAALIRDTVQESLTLDYKSCGALDKRNPKARLDLSKDVSAFANSAGGVLVYGIVEVNNLPVRIDTGYDPTDITREWIEQVINSSIQRRIDGIRIKQIELKRYSPGRFAYVVFVPQSYHAPHMASDHIFYKRFNYLSIAMEEYEVRDVARRSEVPDLYLSFTLASKQPIISRNKALSKYIPINCLVKNNAPAPAMYFLVKLFIDARLQFGSTEEVSQAGQVLVDIDNTQAPMHLLLVKWGVPNKMPLWEGIAFRCVEPYLQISHPQQDGGYDLLWEIHSPGMMPRKGRYILQLKDGVLELMDQGWVNGLVT